MAVLSSVSSHNNSIMTSGDIVMRDASPHSSPKKRTGDESQVDDQEKYLTESPTKRQRLSSTTAHESSPGKNRAQDVAISQFFGSASLSAGKPTTLTPLLNKITIGHRSENEHFQGVGAVSTTRRKLAFSGEIKEDRKETAKRTLQEYISQNSDLQEYKKIPAENLYKLFIDGDRWEQLVQGDPDLIFDKKEPGYMAAMMETFVWLFSTDQPLSAKFLEELHDHAINGVSTSREPFKAGYRTTEKSNESFGVVCTGEGKKTMTPEGFAELLARFENPAYNLDPTDNNTNIFYTAMKDPRQTIQFVEPVLQIQLTRERKSSPLTLPKELLQKSDNEITKMIIGDWQAKDIIPAGINIESQLRRAVGEYRKKREAFEKPKIVLHPPRNAFFIPQAVNHLIALYMKADKSTDDKKYHAIARLIQDLDQLHPCYDGNIRSYVVELLPKLLKKNGLEPSCLIDPNCVDGLSEAQLVVEIKIGQARFRALQVL